MTSLTRRFALQAGTILIAASVGLGMGPAVAQDQPIKIGASMAQTGPLGAAGRSSLLALHMWAEDVNAKGGLIGRKVELVTYDDQANPAASPGIYARLL